MNNGALSYKVPDSIYLVYKYVCPSPPFHMVCFCLCQGPIVKFIPIISSSKDPISISPLPGLPLQSIHLPPLPSR